MVLTSNLHMCTPTSTKHTHMYTCILTYMSYAYIHRYKFSNIFVSLLEIGMYT